MNPLQWKNNFESARRQVLELAQTDGAAVSATGSLVTLEQSLHTPDLFMPYQLGHEGPGWPARPAPASPDAVLLSATVHRDGHSHGGDQISIQSTSGVPQEGERIATTMTDMVTPGTAHPHTLSVTQQRIEIRNGGDARSQPPIHFTLDYDSGAPVARWSDDAAPPPSAQFWPAAGVLYPRVF